MVVPLEEAVDTVGLEDTTVVHPTPQRRRDRWYLWKRPGLIHSVPAETEPTESAVSFPL